MSKPLFFADRLESPSMLGLCGGKPMKKCDYGALPVFSLTSEAAAEGASCGVGIAESARSSRDRRHP